MTDTRELWNPESDVRPWEQTQAEQLRAIPAFVDRICQTSPFYRRHLADVAHPPDELTLEQLADLPVTTKEDLRTAQSDGGNGQRLLGDLQSVTDDELVQVIASSGTTGTPVYYGITHQDLTTWRRVIANVFWTAGIRDTDRVALTTGMPLVAGGMPFADAIRHTGATLVWTGGQTTARAAGILERLRVTAFVGTASYAGYFATAFEKETGRSARQLGVRTVIGGGEPGLGIPEIRRQVATSWGAAQVSEIMGLGDVLPGMWAECHVGQGMHFAAAPDVLVELVDPGTLRPVPWEPEAEGEAIYTSLTREAMPVLRYRSRDHLRVTATSCACGRTAPTVRCIGRTDDMLIYKGMNVFPSSIRDVVLGRLGDAATGQMRLRKQQQGQVRFDDPIPLEVEFTRRVDPHHRAQLVRDVEEAVRQTLRVRVSVEALGDGEIPVGAYKNAMTYVAETTP